MLFITLGGQVWQSQDMGLFQVHGFYKGMGFPLLTSSAQNSLFFGVYGNSLRVLESYHQQYNPENSVVSKYRYIHVLLAGTIAGIVQVAIAAPIDLVKIKLQSQTGTFRFIYSQTRLNLHIYMPICCLLITMC
jgi:hypothetical protein